MAVIQKVTCHRTSFFSVLHHSAVKARYVPSSPGKVVCFWKGERSGQISEKLLAGDDISHLREKTLIQQKCSHFFLCIVPLAQQLNVSDVAMNAEYVYAERSRKREPNGLTSDHEPCPAEFIAGPTCVHTLYAPRVKA